MNGTVNYWINVEHLLADFSKQYSLRPTIEGYSFYVTVTFFLAHQLHLIFLCNMYFSICSPIMYLWIIIYIQGGVGLAGDGG